MCVPFIVYSAYCKVIIYLFQGCKLQSQYPPPIVNHLLDIFVINHSVGNIFKSPSVNVFCKKTAVFLRQRKAENLQSSKINESFPNIASNSNPFSFNHEIVNYLPRTKTSSAVMLTQMSLSEPEKKS